MSIQSYIEAMDHVLNEEIEARGELVVLRVGAYPALAESDREICLPRDMEELSPTLAVGAALAGCHAVLDLRAVSGAFLSDALQKLPDPCPPLTILLNAPQEDKPIELHSVRRFMPKTPRQAAGFTRAALRMDGPALLVLDQSLYDEREDVPDDDDFMLMPAEEESAALPTAAAETEAADDDPVDVAPCEEEDAPEAADNVYEEIEEEMPLDTSAEAPAPNPALPAEVPQKEVLCLSARRIPFDAQALNALSLQLDTSVEHIKRLCMERLSGQITTPFEWMDESDALPGECAYLAPASAAALLWLGADVMTVTYDAKRLSHADAAMLLRSAQRLLQNPLLLIYDKERDT